MLLTLNFVVDVPSFYLTDEECKCRNIACVDVDKVVFI